MIEKSVFLVVFVLIEIMSSTNIDCFFFILLTGFTLARILHHPGSTGGSLEHYVNKLGKTHASLAALDLKEQHHTGYSTS